MSFSARLSRSNFFFKHYNIVIIYLNVFYLIPLHSGIRSFNIKRFDIVTLAIE